MLKEVEERGKKYNTNQNIEKKVKKMRTKRNMNN